MLPSFLFTHAEQLVSILEKLEGKITDEAALLRWSNPLMVMVLSLDVLYKIRDSFRSLSIRVNSVTDQITSTYIKIYENYYDPERVQVQLLQRDINN